MDLKKYLQSPYFWLYGAGAILLLLNLGTGNIINSEARWTVVAREMLASGDWLHPTINGQPYFDKPLVSYWFICIVSWLAGVVNTWTARLPSALAGLVTLYCTVRIARQLFDERAGLWAGWSLIAFYSFAYYGRSAEADMLQTAAVIGATAVYFAVRESRRVWGYMLFWTICAVGAQTKGLGAIILPAGVAGLDMLWNRTILKHCSWRSLVGILTGAVVYSLPFVLESLSRGGYDASGIVLVFRENIVRVINPWDHNKDPWWIYFKYLPRLLLPWAPVFALAFVHYAVKLFRREMVSRELRWLMSAIIFIFILFSASKSRRVYYILPIIPFCAMLCGVYLSRPVTDWTGKIVSILVKIVSYLLPAAGVIALFAPLGFLPQIYRQFLPEGTALPFSYMVLLLGLPVVGAAMLFLNFFAGKWCRRDNLALIRCLGGIWVIFVLVFGVAMPVFGSDPAVRTERRFGEYCHAVLRDNQIPAGNVAFWSGIYPNMVYYMNLPAPAVLFSYEGLNNSNRNFFSDSTEMLDIHAFRKFLQKVKQEGGAVLMRRDNGMDLLSQAPDVAAEFFLPDGSLQEGVILEPVSVFQQKSMNSPKKMIRRTRKKMLLKIYPVPAEARKQ